MALDRAWSLTSPLQDRREQPCRWRGCEGPLWDRSLGNEELALVAPQALAQMGLCHLPGFRNNAARPEWGWMC